MHIPLHTLKFLQITYNSTMLILCKLLLQELYSKQQKAKAYMLSLGVSLLLINFFKFVESRGVRPSDTEERL